MFTPEESYAISGYLQLLKIKQNEPGARKAVLAEVEKTEDGGDSDIKALLEDLAYKLWLETTDEEFCELDFEKFS